MENNIVPLPTGDSLILSHYTEVSDNAAYINQTSGYAITNTTAVSQRSLPEIIIIGFILMILVITTILGNLLVCIVILKHRRMQTPTNYFILSLSLSDLFLGILVLPFSAMNSILPEWPLGPVFCNIYTSTDVMLCTVSILNLFAISLDRYHAVTHPLRYVQIVTSRRVFWVCTAIWIFSFLMAFVPIHFGLNTDGLHVQSYAMPSQCVFEVNYIYVLLVAVFTYFIPLIIMCVVYMKVYYIAKKQVKRINQMTAMSHHVIKQNGNHSKQQQNGSCNHQPCHHVHHNGNGHQNHHRKEHNNHHASDNKATFTLASVVMAFAICWVPYFIVFTIKPFLTQPVNYHVDLLVLWLGYVNSLLNPFLYAFHNTEFRYAFMMVLCRKMAEKYRDKYIESSMV